MEFLYNYKIGDYVKYTSPLTGNFKIFKVIGIGKVYDDNAKSYHYFAYKLKNSSEIITRSSRTVHELWAKANNTEVTLYGQFK